MKAILGLVLVLLCVPSFASAETIRVYGSYGLIEFDGVPVSPKPCGPETRDIIRKYMEGGLPIIIGKPEMSAFLNREERRMIPTSRTFTDNLGRQVGVWNLGKRSLVIAVGPRRHGKLLPARYRNVTITLLVEVDADKRDQVSCFERWDGIVEVD